jgi:hypothetical protein
MHLAQFNVSKELAPLDSPAMQDFIASLERINGCADRAEGFVWRLHDESGNATAMRVFEDRSIIFNLSVWKSLDTLSSFVYRSAHAGTLARRREWFAAVPDHTYVLWWVPEGHVPSVEEAKERLAHLRRFHETPHAFTFHRAFGEDGANV